MENDINNSNMSFRKIIHVDMDAFYTSVEQRDSSRYRGVPLAVGGMPEQRSVIAAASYEARVFGVKSAMASKTALLRCPQLIIVPPRMNVYKQVSQQIHGIFHRYTNLVEGLAYDEAFLDVSDAKDEHKNKYATQIAKEIKKKIKDELQLSASAGVSYNKFLAKLASDENKPDGFCVILPEKALDYVAFLPVERFFGVGPVTAKKMHSLNIKMGLDLRMYDFQKLVLHFGNSAAQHYRNLSYAIDNREVETQRKIKSMSVEHSYTPSLQTQDEIQKKIDILCTVLHQRTEGKNVHPHTFTLKIKYDDFKQTTRSCTVENPFYTVKDFFKFAMTLLHEQTIRATSIRLLGIGLSHFKEPSKQLYLQFE